MKKLIFKFLGKEHIDEIYELTSEVYEGIENKEIFSHDSKRDLEHLIDNGGAFVGVYDGDRLVAYRSLKVPDKEDNLAYDVDFFVDPDKVIINDTVVVLKEYRGRNLQNLTREKLEEKYKDSKFSHKMSTISPKNHRFILLKSEDINFDFTGEEITIHSSETEKLKEAFEANYVGVAVDDEGNILFKEAKIV